MLTLTCHGSACLGQRCLPYYNPIQLDCNLDGNPLCHVVSHVTGFHTKMLSSTTRSRLAPVCVTSQCDGE